MTTAEREFQRGITAAAEILDAMAQGFAARLGPGDASRNATVEALALAMVDAAEAVRALQPGRQPDAG